jgi:centromeric protein E
VINQSSIDLTHAVPSSNLSRTIFAYGQTSSGKTFTMQGSGSLDSISHLNIDGGIVHMAASDIFQHIEASTDRVFLVRVSFIEIYNEEVRDLLVSGGDDNTLSVREDPRRGVFVNSNETIVTGLDSLLSVLFAGEKNRSVASTGMNERSSRSHTIFRITVESRLKSAEKNDTENEESDEEMEDVDDNEMSNGNGAVRVSTLNLVDLAGSESVRHTGATGDRQKEGGKINQSLLTLSRVIGSLGQNATHINFRDSKLTRILQPSLSGNARMAVICCATPSELYLEETRSTLQFASRAKLVKTRAQVNEVLDDRSLIKKLQRELKEARDAGNGTMDTEKMKALEEKAVTEAEAKRKAEHDLKRMKDLILKGGVLPMNISYDGDGKSSLFKSLFIYNDAEQTIKTGSNSFFLKEQKGNGKRRYSDGAIKCSSPVRDVTNKPERATFNSPKGDTITRVQAKTEIKPKKPKSASQISISALTEENDIDLLRQALAAKSSQTLDLKSKLSSSLDQTQALEQKLLRERGEKEMLRLAKQDLEFQVTALASDKEFVMTEQGIVCEEKNDEIGTYLSKIELMLIERKEQAQSVNELNALVESLQNQIESIKNDHASAVETLSQQRTNELAEVQSQFLALRNQMKTMETEHVSATQAMKEVHKAELKTLQDEHDEVVDEMKSEVDSLRSQVAHLRSSHDTEVAQHKSDAEEARLKVGATNDQIEQLKHEHFAEMEKLKEVHSAAMAQSQSEKDDAQSKLALQEETCQAQAAKILELESSVQEMQALLEKTKMEKEKAEENLTAVTREMEVSESRCANQVDVIKKLESSVEELNQRLLAEDFTAQVLHSKVADLTNQNSELESEKTSLQMEIDEKAKSLEATTAKLQDAAEATAGLEELVEELKDSLSGCEAKLQKTETCLTSVTSELNTANSEKAALKEEIELLTSAKESSDEQLERLVSVNTDSTSRLNNICTNTPFHLSRTKQSPRMIQSIFRN